MDLEVVGRHALFFDDDAMAAFVTSSDALVEWHSLQIDRYDVRHLLSAPPPPRHRHRNAESKSSDEFLIDQERYLDLPPESDQPDIEDDEKPCGDGYHSVSFSYGDTEDSAAQKDTDGGMDSSGYLPPFTIPGNIVQSLPPTEKVHQIIARTAMFVSKHGGQSEIILRVKQGDNPTFGFLMPDHHLHAYFKYLVEHPELLDTESGEKSQKERKKAGSEHDESDSVGGALSLLGSVYGSAEDEDGDDGVHPSLDHGTEKGESVENVTKDEPISRKPILSNKENVPMVKKNSSIIASKPKNVKGIKKEGNSGMFSAAEKSKNYDIGATSKSVTVEPPLEIKKLIDKLVEFIMKNGKQFEATLIEQDSDHERFPFLLPSNQYHSYYLKALQAAEESKVNGKRIYFGKDDLGGRWINKKSSALGGNDLSLSTSDCDVPFESDRKEKFKMVIGKSKKEEQERENEALESGVTVDAAAAAAILQAATRGIKNSGSYNHLNRSEGENATLGGSGSVVSSDAILTEEQKRKAERLKKAKMFVAMLKSGAVPTKTGTSRGSSVEPLESGVLRSASEVNLTNQREGSLGPAVVNKLAAAGYSGERQSERLSKRKYRSKPGGCEDDEDSHSEEHEEDHSSWKYKSRSKRDEDDRNENALENGHQSYSSMEYKNEGASSEEDRDRKHSKSMHLPQHVGDERDEKHNKHHSKRKYRSKSRRHEDEEAGNAVEKQHRHHRRRLRTHTSSEENENGEESDESDREHKRYKPTRRSHYSNSESLYEEERDKKYLESRSRRRHGSSSRGHEEENEIESTVEDKYHQKRHSTHSSHEENNGGESGGDDKDEDNGHEVHKEEKDRKRSKKSHHSSHESSRKRHSSEQRKRHSSHHSSHHSRDKHRHRNSHSSRDKESRHQHRHDSSSDDELQHYTNSDKPEKELQEERDELEEGEISSKVSEESRGITSSDAKKGTSVDLMSSQQRAPSQPSVATEIPADLRAKIRAMLLATRS